jgi:hypothetical protein
MRTRFWWESQKKKPLVRIGHRWENIIKKDLDVLWAGFFCLRIWTSGGLW